MQRVAAAAVVAANFIAVIHATSLWIYADDDFDKHKTFKRFDFEGVQRCYSIADCFNDRASSASWKNVQGDGVLVFYDEEYCSGKQYGSIRTPNGEMKFADVGLDNIISSFMV